MRYFCWSFVDQAVKTSFHERNLSLICPNDLQMILQTVKKDKTSTQNETQFQLECDWLHSGACIYLGDHLNPFKQTPRPQRDPLTFHNKTLF